MKDHVAYGSLLDIGVACGRASSPGVANRDKRANLGQFFTPPELATFMATLFPRESMKTAWNLLDPGTGEGALTKAIIATAPNPPVYCDLYECDEALIPALERIAASSFPARINVHCSNFIEAGINLVLQHKSPFTHAILNPPYRKLASSSRERHLLQMAGLETVNFYSAFTALALALLKPNGHLVAIIPRSFCNGSYFKNFRKYILANSAIRQIHLFTSRTEMFSGVLQENLIIHLEKFGIQGKVKISASHDGNFFDYKHKDFNLEDIVNPASPNLFFHIPGEETGKLPEKAKYSLADLGVEVSTGPIVEFRLKKFLHKEPLANDVPLLYPAHFRKGFSWPITDFKKFNSVLISRETSRFFYQMGWYVVLRRLSSKEEKRRIVPSIVNPDNFIDAKFLGFENHLNVFHSNRSGLDPYIAKGLFRYLNSKIVERAFRSFNGSTQVNATDLRALTYPSRDMLIKIAHNPDKNEKWLEEILN